MFAAMGTLIYGQRQIAACRSDMKKASKEFWEIELLSVITTTACFFVWCIVIALSDQYKVYYIVLSMTLLSTAFDITWFFMGMENIGLVVLRNTVIRLTGIGILFIFVKEKTDLLLYIALTAATGLLGNISMWLSLKKYLVRVPVRELKIRHHLKETLIYFIPTVAMSIYTVLDKIMIGLITNNTYENGYYEQATKIINMAKMPLHSFNTVISSRMSFLFTSGKLDEMRSRLRDGLDFSATFGIAISFGILAIARTLVPVFFGPGYEEVVSILYIAAPLVLVTCISNLIGHQYLIPSGQRARSSKAVIAGAVCNLVLNSFFIPLLGAMGAMIASVAAQLLITVLYIRMSEKYVTLRMVLISIGKRCVAGLIMLAVGLLIGARFVKTLPVLLIQIVVCAVVYIAILLAMKDDYIIRLLGQIMKKIHLLLHKEKNA